jgi:peptide chain release factor 1
MSPLVIELRVGEGGDDAKEFCLELLAAIAAYARRRGDPFEVTPTRPGARTFVIRVDAPFEPYVPLAGVHRVQRVPKNSTRRHTSTATIAVLGAPQWASPSALDDRDVRIQHYRASGPGGQHRNKTDSACRAVHLPTGLTAAAEDSRSQRQNTESAKRKLQCLLAERASNQAATAVGQERRRQISTAERPAKQFTHNRDQRGQVVCHETGTVWRWSDFYRGRLDRGHAA